MGALRRRGHGLPSRLRDNPLRFLNCHSGGDVAGSEECSVRLFYRIADAECADAHADSSVAQTGWKRAGGLSCPDCGKGRDSPAPCRFWEKNARGSKRNGRPNVTFSSYFGSRIDFPTIHGLHLGPDWLGNLGGARVPEEFGSFWSQDQCDCQSICCNNDCGS